MDSGSKKIFVLLLALVSPATVYAADPTYKLLAPLGPLSGAVTLTDYLQGLVTVTIGVAGILAVVMIVICGVQLIGSPSVSQKSASKECIWSAVVGLLLAISSWVILNTINSQLLSSELALADLPAAPAVTRTEIDEPMPTAPGTYYRYRHPTTNRLVNSGRFEYAEACINTLENFEYRSAVVKVNDVECFQVYAPPPGAPPPPGSPATIPPGDEANKRNEICGNTSCIGSKPVGINRAPCATPASRGCTDVRGFPSEAIQSIKDLASRSGEAVIITGATEAGHSFAGTGSHAPGNSVFDLRKTAKLDSWIRTNSTQSANSFSLNGRSLCRYKLKLSGVDYWFTDEGDHWHSCKLGSSPFYCKDIDRSGVALPAGFYINCPAR